MFKYNNSNILYKTDGLIFTPINYKLKEEKAKERDYLTKIKK